MMKTDLPSQISYNIYYMNDMLYLYAVIMNIIYLKSYESDIIQLKLII